MANPAARSPSSSTAAPQEVARFTALAETWWDPNGAFHPLHKFNPARLTFIRERALAHFGRDPHAPRPFEGLRLLDIGCGGGLLCEPLARLGFQVTGIDAGEKNVAVARIHAEKSGLPVDYRAATPEILAGEQFDVVLAMEVIEHVPDVHAFLAACCTLVRPEGLFFGATINRTAKAYALAVVGAEYVLRWLPRGTHDWRKFLKPSEFAAHLRHCGILVKELKGMSYNIVKDEWRVTQDLDVNYMLAGVREG